MSLPHFGASVRVGVNDGGITKGEVPYSRIHPAELKELEMEFGRPLTPELAQWLIRARTNREAVERMEGVLCEDGVEEVGDARETPRRGATVASGHPRRHPPRHRSSVKAA